MQHERSDKPSALHSRLDGLEGLPGEPAPDTAALWNRLERRMDLRPAFQRRYGLWAAASILLLAGAAVWFAYQPQNLRQVQQPAYREQPPVAKNSDPESNAVLPPQPQPVTQVQHTTVKSNRRKPASFPAVLPPDPATVEAPLAETNPPATEVQLPPAEPPANNAVASVEKPPVRKLRVVHLNEIGKQVPPGIPAPSGSQLVARTSAPAYHEGRGSITFSRNTSDDIIKINISPTN